MNGAFGNNRLVFWLLIALFLVASIGGVFSLCGMSPMEHLSHWQEISAATAQQMPTVALLSLMVVAAFWFFFQISVAPALAGARILRHKNTGRVFDPLRLAFARGILHTKAY